MRKVYEEFIREVGIMVMTGLARCFKGNLELTMFGGGLEMESEKRRPPLIAVHLLREGRIPLHVSTMLLTNGLQYRVHYPECSI